jgi:hypothetical protein
MKTREKEINCRKQGGDGENKRPSMTREKEANCKENFAKF